MKTMDLIMDLKVNFNKVSLSKEGTVQMVIVAKYEDNKSRNKKLWSMIKVYGWQQARKLTSRL